MYIQPRIRWTVMNLAACTALMVATQGQDRALAPGLGFTRDFEVEQPDPGFVYSMAVHDDGTGPKLYMGGEFYAVTGVLPFMSRNIVSWDGTNWSRVGWGVSWDPDEFNPGVFALCSYDSGNGAQLYLAGSFSRYWSDQAGGWVPGYQVLRWDGNEFHELLPLYPHLPHPWHLIDMIVFDDGGGPKLYLPGYNGGPVARWDGEAYSPAGSAISLSDVRFCIHDDGMGTRLYATSVWPSASQPTNGLSAWDGTTWSEVPIPVPLWTQPPAPHVEVEGIASVSHANGPALYIARYANGVGELWRYRGGAWDQPLLPGIQGIGPVIDGLGSYDDGNGPALYAIGRFIQLPGMAPGTWTRHARFDGTTWTALGLPQSESGQVVRVESVVYDFGEGPDLYLSGDIGRAGGQDTWFLARYRGVHRVLSAVCGGDGSLSLCPCNTRGAVGHGCPNSTTHGGARLEGAGAGDALRLDATSLPPNALAILFQGDGYSYSPTFSGDGVRCTTGTLLRLATRTAHSGGVGFPGPGEPSLRTRAGSQGDTLPTGAVRYYQVWYRDPDPAFCASGGLFNTTNGMRVEW